MKIPTITVEAAKAVAKRHGGPDARKFLDRQKELFRYLSQVMENTSTDDRHMFMAGVSFALACLEEMKGPN